MNRKLISAMQYHKERRNRSGHHGIEKDRMCLLSEDSDLLGL